MAEQDQHRPEPATPFKLAEARKQGQVAKSPDFNASVVVCALLAVVLLRGESIAAHVGGLCAWLFRAAADLPLEDADHTWLGALFVAALDVVTPFALVGFLLAMLANLVQTGPIFTTVPLKPKFERINPVEGFKRIFSKRILIDLLKTVLKLLLFGAVLYAFGHALLPDLPGLTAGESDMHASWLAARSHSLLARLGALMLVIGILDFVYMRWQFHRQMMMSRRELKEEMKRREGDPQLRAKLRELQKENVKQARSLSRVPEADVLITNPEHFAIALKYTRGEMSAPHVVAKGMNAWALDMRQLARRHGIPVYERRKLARHLFRRALLDRPIPADVFIDVARIYADVEAQRRRLARYEVVQ